MLITFSGLDGSGKSTLIEGLTRSLRGQDKTCVVLTMYDHISFYSLVRNIRDSLKGWVGKRPVKPLTVENPAPIHSGVIPQDPKVDVSDKKNILVRFLYGGIRSQLMRKIFIPLDMFVLLMYRFKEEILCRRILITDRYLYDTLIDIIKFDGKGWGFVRFILKLAPKPDLPVFVNVPAEKAYERKPEYPLDYTQWRQGAYQKIFGLVSNPLILDNQDLALTLVRLEGAVKKISQI